MPGRLKKKKRTNTFIGQTEKAKIKTDGEEMVDYKQKYVECKKCIQGSEMAIQHRKVKATRMSIINTLLLSDQNGLEILDIA